MDGGGALRVLQGTLDYAPRHGIITSNPGDALARHERPKQQMAKDTCILSGGELEQLVSAATSNRWRCGIALAAFGGSG